MKTLAPAMLMLLLSSLASAPARAQAPTAQCSMTEFLASNDKKGVDPKLEKLKGKLTKAPFTAYDTFTSLGDSAATLGRGKPTATKLANGQVTLLFKDKLTVADAKARLRLGIEIDDKTGTRILSTVVTMDSGDTIIQGPKPYEQKGSWFLALSCTTD